MAEISIGSGFGGHNKSLHPGRGNFCRTGIIGAFMAKLANAARASGLKSEVSGASVPTPSSTERSQSANRCRGEGKNVR